MEAIKTIFFIMALTLILTLTTSEPAGFPERKPGVATKRAGRFLQGIINPRVTINFCNRDSSICSLLLKGLNPICCNNKCVASAYDGFNCGACGRRCAFGQVCCKGECVNLVRDIRHCGFCNNLCKNRGRCVFGICDYA